MMINRSTDSFQAGRVTTLFALCWFSIAGCGGRMRESYFASHAPLGSGRAGIVPLDAGPGAGAGAEADPRRLPMYAGATGARLGWPDVVQAVAWADAIFLGEQHDDATGHAVQLALVQDAIYKPWREHGVGGGAGQTVWKAPELAISLEMLERDEQQLIDDYLDGIIDAQTFAKETFSESWAGEGSWASWYQPIIDAAKSADARVIAANAPRRYVRLARTGGYEALRELDAERRALFALPRGAVNPGYRARFADVVASHGETGRDGDPNVPRDAEFERRVDDGLRSQSLWDATTADSIARARRAGADKVIHLLGQFHSDFGGGTVEQLQRRIPKIKIITISMQRDEGAALRAEDRGRADIVIYTGPAPEPKEDEPAE